MSDSIGESQRCRRSASAAEQPDTARVRPRRPSEPRQRQADQPLDARIEFVVLDGDEGKHFAQRQATVMRQVLAIAARPGGQGRNGQQPGRLGETNVGTRPGPTSGSGFVRPQGHAEHPTLALTSKNEGAC
jgi:hypothetical protein